MVKMGEIEFNLEKYKRELKILEKKRNGVCSELNKLEKERMKLENEIYNLNTLINSLKIREIKISSHCMLRYFERILGYNLDEIKQNILTNKIKEQYFILGDGNYQNGNFVLVIKNDTVITLIDKDDET
jgi:chromosome segregation ATPase